jgi:Putative 2OG-Fe(II) oxygenase
MDIDSIPIFTTNVFKFKASNHDKIKKYLMDNVYQNFLNEPANDVLANIYTDYCPGAVKVPWAMLSKFYEVDVKKFLESTGVDFNDGWTFKFTCWYGFTTNTTSEFVHDHTGGPKTIQWSAVHYVVLDDAYGTIFCDPCARQKKSVIPTKNKNYVPSIYYPNKQMPTVEESDVIVFPSWVEHHTPRHETGTLRVVVAMNIMLRRISDTEGL